MDDQYLLMTDLSPEVLLQIIYYIDDLQIVLRLQQTCKYIYELININKNYITVTKTFIYQLIHGVYIARTVDICQTGIFVIKVLTYKDIRPYTINGNLVNNKIIYCDKKYDTDREHI